MKKKKFLASLLMCAVAATGVCMTSVLSACKPQDDGPQNTQTGGDISLNQTKLSLAMNGQYILRAILTEGLIDSPVTWSSSDTSVATVSGGLVKGIGAGKAVITATAGDKNASCTVTVWEGVVNETEDEVAEVSTKVVGNVYYVSPNGKANASGTEADPYDIRTLLDFDHTNDDSGVDYGDPILQPGDTVMVLPGEYDLSERIQIGYSGDYLNPITIKNADPTQKATLKFYAMKFDDNNRGVQINGDYFIWDGVDICGAGDNGMYIGGSYNVVMNSEFYDNRDTGLQLGRAYGTRDNVNQWPSYNLIKNCTSYNNYDNETYGENADGFAAKLTVGYGNIFDGCIAYRNSDDGWDLYAKVDSGNIGAVIVNNCVAFENGYIGETQESFNAKFPTFDQSKAETNTNSFKTRDGDGNGFKLGGSKMEGEVFLTNSLSFNNRMHGVTDNSNPGVLICENVTSYNNGAGVDNDEYFAYDADENKLSGVTITKNTDDTFTVVRLEVQKDENGNDLLDEDGNQIIQKVVIEDAIVRKNEQFGWISYNENADSCANIDLARQTYSYNHISNILSIINGNNFTDSDAYRGTVANSILATKGGASYYRIDGVNEYDTNIEDRGTKLTTNPVAEDVFIELPERNLGIKGGDGYPDYYHYIHHLWRNEDGSINVGNLLMQKDTSSTYGCLLNKSSYSEYEHWAYSDMTEYANRQEGTAQAIADILYLPIQEENCFQDFQVVARMMGYPIYWESSNPEILNVSAKVYDSISGSYVNKVEVLRSDESDKVVTLTATINIGNVATKVKTFEINVLKNTYKVGDIIVDGVVDDEIIVDQYSGYNIVDPEVKNATSESGKIIDPSKYTLSYKYELAASDGDGRFTSKRSFTSNSSGIWRITVTVKLNDGVTLKTAGDDSEVYEYLVYVASPSVKIDFATETVDGQDVSTAGFYLNKDGFTIYGQPTNPTGTIYVKTVAKDATAPTAQEIISGGEKVEFRTTSLNLNFKADNADAYNVYYVFESFDKSQISDVHYFEVTTQDINSKKDFEDMLASNSNFVIYRLMTDIDCEGGSIVTSSTKFVGYFDGRGHTIKNVTLNNTDTTTESFGIFRYVKNGTIMNITFENIVINDVAKKTGIIGLMYGGSIYNVKLHNVTISGQERVGTLVGHICANGNQETINTIENVEVINDAQYSIISLNEEIFGYRKYYTLKDGVYTLASTYDPNETYYDRLSDITNKGKYTGGLVGLIQAGDGGSGWCVVNISNCYVNVALSGDDYCGGIVGRSDDRNVKDSLTISNCYFAGVFKVRVRGAGIIGGFSGAGKTVIKGSISLGTGYYGNNRDIVTTAQKNSSGIVGNFAAQADMTVEKCYATFGEYNSDYDVNTVNAYLLSTGNYASYWENNMGFDLASVWEYVTNAEDGSTLSAPYIRIRNVGQIAG